MNFFSPRNFFPPFLEQIRPFHVCGLPCWLFPLRQRAKNLSESTLPWWSCLLLKFSPRNSFDLFAPLLLLKVGLDKQNYALGGSQTSGKIFTNVGTHWFHSAFLKHIFWGVRVKGQLEDAAVISDFSFSWCQLIHWCASLPDRATGAVTNCVECFLL